MTRWPDHPMTKSPDLPTSPLKKMDDKQDHRSPQRQQQPDAQTPRGMRNHAYHPGNYSRSYRRQREQDRANAASANSEALRESSHGDRIQRSETQSRNQRPANNPRKHPPPP